MILEIETAQSLGQVPRPQFCRSAGPTGGLGQADFLFICHGLFDTRNNLPLSNPL
jgi:hypothetical protein